jgi:hypothetical protein
MLFTLPVTLLFAGVMVVIRAHPYDDDDLRAFLIPDDCPSPCWQGIKPGRMSVENALSVLRAHTWISQVDTSLYDGFRGWIRWDWSGREPPWIIHSERDNLWIDENRVVNVSLMTRIRFGEVWLALGAPDWTTTYQTQGEDRMRVFNGYESGTLVVIFEVTCSGGMESLWFASASLLWPIYLPEGGEIRDGSPKMLSTCE